MYVCIYVGTADPWLTWGLGALTVCAGSEDVALHVHGSFISADSTPGDCAVSTAVIHYWKVHRSGSTRLKLMLFGLSATPWTTACQAPLSMEFSRQEYLLERVAILFSRGSSRPRDWTQVSHIAGRCFNLCLKYKNTVSQKTSYRD